MTNCTMYSVCSLIILQESLNQGNFKDHFAKMIVVLKINSDRLKLFTQLHVTQKAQVIKYMFLSSGTSIFTKSFM